MRQEGQNNVPVPVLPTTSESSATGEILDLYQESHTGIDSVDSTAMQKSKRSKRTEHRAARKIEEWLPLRQDFLDELLRYEGSEHIHSSVCRTCKRPGATFRCSQCHSRRLYCQVCAIDRHTDIPLHILEARCLRLGLRELGVVLQLGHDGDSCPCPSPTTRRLVVVNTDGMHKVEVRFCQCLRHDSTFMPEWVQIFRQGWFPATTSKPATAATFHILNFFHELNFQAKTNLNDFEQTLQRITDNSGYAANLVRYRQMSHCVRLWRHLVALKRAGRGHDPAGAANTQPGELAVECPACPHPGKNLPPDWDAETNINRWLYTLFLMMDGNFRAKLKDRGLDSITLSQGWSYFVETNSFTRFINSVGEQAEKSSCTAEHKAILNANIHREGYITSGVGAILCARHALCRKSGMGDIFLGEKYAIFDYLLGSTTTGLPPSSLLISYDLACQWHKRLPQRAMDLPEELSNAIANLNLRFAIPKKHWHWSLNFLALVGRTYVHTSTREMEPGGRHEVVDDHEGAWNWQKILAMGEYFQNVSETSHKRQNQVHDDFTANLPPLSKNAVPKWEAELTAWQNAPGSVPDPYEEPRAKSSQAAVQEKRNTLKRRIDAWQILQHVHMPVIPSNMTTIPHAPVPPSMVAPALETPRGSTTENTPAEDIDLLLPSALPTPFRVSLHPTLLDKAQRLRLAQADDALDDIRRYRRIITGIKEFNRLNISGTGQRTTGKVRSVYSTFQSKIDRAAERYRAARTALLALDHTGGWQERLKELRGEDIRGPGRPDDEDPTGDGRFIVSWIWLVPRVSGESPVGCEDINVTEVLDNMKYEWSRSKARAERWTEEVALLEEEMRRIVEFFEWKARWWREQATRRGDVSAELATGLAIYAEKQACVFEGLAMRRLIKCRDDADGAR
ncbi:uncharacterized protein BXZ73DRAFT_92737 [Epithele typhae]|uniref:uncharacterized protein n=1 Tax=Epithele typhae TaxID=378194 RepID=UPI00200895AC|nr:uncharacterized protein BXZ73DRAFT_92737 [Epithele typhae]KAH9914777.1 hypothetical protein BXZ73DRAFT_92737 [Epithele typhae]